MTPTWLSRGEFGLVGAHRILALLQAEQVPSTCFIPGHTIESHPGSVAMVRDAGVEIGHHGWTHRTPASLSREGENEELVRGIDAIVKLTGKQPAVADVADNGDVVRHEQVGHAVRLLQLDLQVEDLRPHADVECADRFVANQQRRTEGECAGDADALALALAAAELVRVADADIGEHLQHGGPAGAERGAGCLSDLRADVRERIERCLRFLENHRNAASAEAAHSRFRQGIEVRAVEHHAPRDMAHGGRQQAHGRQCGQRLAAAAFANQRHDLAGRHGETHPVHDAHPVDGQSEAVDLQRGH